MFRVRVRGRGEEAKTGCSLLTAAIFDNNIAFGPEFMIFKA